MVKSYPEIVSAAGTHKPRVLFVSAFPGTQKQLATGGQLYATATLMRSPISEHLSWIPLNTSLEVLPPPPVYRRSVTALRRVVFFTCCLLTRRVDTVLIFASNGPSTLEKGLMAWIAKRFGKRVVYCPRSGLILEDFARNGWLARIARGVFRQVDVVLCQSMQWKRVFQTETGMPDARFSVVPNWIEADPYLSCPPPVTGKPLIILYLGWVETFKGIFDLIRAVAGRRDALHGVRVIVCGGGSKMAVAREWVAALDLQDYFEFKGWVDAKSKHEWLAQADIYVLPSHFEGMPNALIEAMAAGRACIATAVGAIPDLICDASVGRIVPSRDPIALGGALTELARDPTLRLQLGRAARAHILAHHAIAKVYPTIYRAIIGKDLPEAGAPSLAAESLAHRS